MFTPKQTKSPGLINLFFVCVVSLFLFVQSQSNSYAKVEITAREMISFFSYLSRLAVWWHVILREIEGAKVNMSRGMYFTFAFDLLTVSRVGS